MNNEITEDIDLDEKAEQALEAKHAKFALECRKIRMFIASHPGATSYDIKQSVGGRYDMALSKMLGMGIVKCELESIDDRRSFKWFVVPQ